MRYAPEAVSSTPHAQFGFRAGAGGWSRCASVSHCRRITVDGYPPSTTPLALVAVARLMHAGVLAKIGCHMGTVRAQLRRGYGNQRSSLSQVLHTLLVHNGLKRMRSMDVPYTRTA
jgi:hypothetical protein